MSVAERRCSTCNGVIQIDHAFCQLCGARQIEPVYGQAESTSGTRRTLEPKIWLWGGVAVFVFVGFAIGWWQLIRILMLGASTILVVLAAMMTIQYSQLANSLEKRKKRRRAITAGTAAFGFWLFAPSAKTSTSGVATVELAPTTPQAANVPVPAQPALPDPAVLKQQRIGERTLAYWSSARDLMAQAGSAFDKQKKSAEISAALNRYAVSLNSLPTLEVDQEAIECVFLLSKFLFRLADTVDRDASPAVLFESILAAVAGDNPAAPYAGLQQSKLALLDQMRQVREHALKTKVTLTDRYGREFPAWPW